MGSRDFRKQTVEGDSEQLIALKCQQAASVFDVLQTQLGLPFFFFSFFFLFMIKATITIYTSKRQSCVYCVVVIWTKFRVV